MCKKYTISKCILAPLSFLMVILSYFFLNHVPRLLYITSIVLFLILGILILIINFIKHPIIYKLMFFTIVILSLTLVLYIVLYKTGLLDMFTSFEAIKQFILSTKQWGFIVYILITIFQVVVLPIPAALITLVAVAIYGATISFILTSIGTIIGSYISFILGKLFGKKIVAWIVGQKNAEKYADLLNNKGRFLFILMMIFPFFPDDMLCMVAGITSMSYGFFSLVILTIRPAVIAVMCYFGSGSIIPFSGWGIPVWIALFALTVVAFILISRIKTKVMNKPTLLNHKSKEKNKTST